MNKTCTKCGKDKPPSEYHKSGVRHRADCNACVKKSDRKRYEANGDRLREKSLAEYYANPARRLKTLYGITLEDFDRMMEEQGGICAICGRPPKVGGRKLDVDHCHKTKKVRGLLCFLCNRGLGFFRDNPERLRKAADYLSK